MGCRAQERVGGKTFAAKDAGRVCACDDNRLNFVIRDYVANIFEIHEYLPG